MYASPRIFTFLDLEMNQPSGKIIQIGACVGNIDTGEILEELQILTWIDEPLNPFITDLTGITQEDMDNKSELLITGYRALFAMHKKYNSFCNPVTWGGGDSKALEEQVRERHPDEPLCFGRRWVDTKTLFQCWRISQNEKIQAGLAKALIKMGLKFQGTKHTALDDAKNTFYIFKALLKKQRA